MANIRVRGLTIEINADMTGFAKEFRKSDAYVKTLKSELKDVDKLLNNQNWGFNVKDSGALDLLAQKQKYLQETIDETKRRIQMEQEDLAALEKMDSTPEVIKLQEALQRELFADQQKLKDLEGELEDFGSVSKQVWLERAKEIQEWGENVQKVGQSLTSTGRTLTTNVTKPLISVGTAAVSASMDFESSLAKVRSVTQGVTEGEMQLLRDQVLGLASDSKFSASEASDALYYMGLAGWDASEMLEALPDVLNLAAAGDLDLSRASDIVTDYITAFGLEAKDATYFVDVMAQTMANSNTDVDQLGQAFKYVAPVAGAMGYSVEDVSLALGIMANNGIKASQAGTTLRQLMQRLAKPTAEVAGAMEELGISLEDENGNAYSFKEILDNIRKSLNDTGIPLEEMASQVAELDAALENGEITEEEYDEALQSVLESAEGVTGAEKAKAAAILAGTRGMSGLLAIVNTTADEYDGLANKINNASGASKEIADIMLDTTEGSILKLQHSVQELGISFGDLLLPKIQEIIKNVGEWVNKFKSMDNATKETIIQVGLFAAAAGPALVAIGSLVSSIGSITSAIGGLAAFIIANPVFSVIAAAVTALTAVTIAATAEHEKYLESMYGLGEAEQALVEKVSAEKTAYDDMVATRDEQIALIDTEAQNAQTLWEALDEITDAQGRVQEGYQARAEYITGKLSEITGIEIDLVDGTVQEYGYLKLAIEDVIAAKRREAIINQYQDDYEAALINVGEAQHDMLLAEDALIAAQSELNAAQEEYDEILLKNQQTHGQYGNELSLAREKVEELQENVDELSGAYDDARGMYQGYMSTIQNYEGVMSAIANGDVKEMDVAVQKLTDGFVSATNASKTELEAQVANYKQQYALMKQAVEDGNTGITDAQLSAMEQLISDAEGELQEWTDAYHEKGREAARQLGDGLLEYGDYVMQSGAEINQKAWKALSADTTALGKSWVDGFAQGMTSSTSMVKVQNAASSVVRQAMNTANYVMDAGSPSRKMMESGEWFSEGFAIGIEDQTERAVNAADQLVRASMGAVGQQANYGATTNNSYGAISVTINGANVQNDAELADMVADRINREVLRRQAVYA